jgi:hypothetical protein
VHCTSSTLKIPATNSLFQPHLPYAKTVKPLGSSIRASP